MNFSFYWFSCVIGGNGTGQGNETEDEDHEFFDAVEEGVTSAMEDKTSFVIKVPVSSPETLLFTAICMTTRKWHEHFQSVYSSQNCMCH